MISSPKPQPSPVVTKPLPKPAVSTPHVVAVGLGQSRAREIERFVQQQLPAPRRR